MCGDCPVRVVTDQPATAEVGVTLAQANQGKGLATEALTAVVTELFDQRSVHRVFAQADDRNVAGPRTAQALGLPLRGAPGRGRLVQGRVVDPARLQRCWTGSGASGRTRRGNNVHRLLVTVRIPPLELDRNDSADRLTPNEPLVRRKAPFRGAFRNARTGAASGRNSSP